MRAGTRPSSDATASGDTVPGAVHGWLQYPIMALYCCLLYKQVAAGVAMLVLCSAMCVVSAGGRRMAASIVTTPAASLAIAYTALATVSAFMVSWPGGIERTVQFALTTLAAITTAGYLHALGPSAFDRFRIRFAVLNLAILMHVVAFHLLTGHVVTWKYLYDTKFVFSSMVVVVFLFEDRIRNRGIAAWFTALSLLALLVLMSGERKAYVLLLLIFLMSRASLASKVMTLGVAAALTMTFVSAMPQSYVARQLRSEAADSSQLSNRFFFTVESIGQHSDYIRTFVNRNAQLLFEAHPVLGTGSTGYMHWARKKYGSLTGSRGLSMNVHGERYRVPAENGIVGILTVLAYLTATAGAAVRFAWRRGGLEAGAHARFPLYMLGLLCTYIYGEAMDTTMLLLILLTGFIAAVPRPAAVRAGART
ncbi:hypothetical protein [Novosphingobium resinovorum]|uniref:hypothetical protein n=1 Tax=Novosphingobium resinovorum TaxID=158500 RepID=UPI002ED5BC5E|nr:hypothetical protein [Novosphingobium resinovorum]